jgi:probable HAF family extracellular repeat protein
MVDLGTLGGPSTATAMNDVNQVAGYSVNPDGYTTAVLYENGSAIDLGTLGRCQELFCSMATGINNSGHVVGRAYLANGPETPFLYRDGEMMNLNDLISDPGWRMIFAFAINDAGQIVGAAVPPGPDYYAHAVLLTPTAP